ncbi:unnamed protein product, partial [Ectocarpus sp. 6 AP-2014]
ARIIELFHNLVLFHQNLTAAPTAAERRAGVHCACREAKHWCSSDGGGIYCALSIPQQGDQEGTVAKNLFNPHCFDTSSATTYTATVGESSSCCISLVVASLARLERQQSLWNCARLRAARPVRIALWLRKSTLPATPQRQAK